MWRPPAFSLKTAMLQLRLRYATMWWSHTRANICDLESAFKYGSVDRSFACYKFKYKLICTVSTTSQSGIAIGCVVFRQVCMFTNVQEFTSLSMRMHKNKGSVVIIAHNLKKNHIFWSFKKCFLYGESLLIVHNYLDQYDFSVCVCAAEALKGRNLSVWAQLACDVETDVCESKVGM